MHILELIQDAAEQARSTGQSTTVPHGSDRFVLTYTENGPRGPGWYVELSTPSCFHSGKSFAQSITGIRRIITKIVGA